MFGKKKTPKEQSRELKKEIRHNERDLERELWNLDREEQKLIAQIKKEAAKGTSQKALKTLAGNLVQLRGQKERLLTMKAQVTGVGYKASLMASQAAVGQAMGSVAGVMGKVNEQMNPTEVAKVMQEFGRQVEMSAAKEDMLTDALSDAFDGEEEEADEVVSSVLQELALETGTKMVDAPQHKLPTRAEAETDSVSDAEALKALEQLLPPSGT